ncbi:MAG: molecular chaperone TorD family protein [Alphaproteobacteria bacterium]|nr:molecular chaperone TorD family protein [Alphaproteobacteria bacterium]
MNKKSSDAGSSALDEETARAELYGLLAMLYLAAPSPEVWQALRLAVTEAPASGAFLEEPWRHLVGLSRDLTLQDVTREYDDLFGGVGKPDVDLFGSLYQSGFLNERPLAELRTDLAELGLERNPQAGFATEDHIAYLFEVMRFLIAGDDVEICNLRRQNEFFMRHLHGWVDDLCTAIEAHPRARFYAGMAGLTRAFVSIERQAFDML